jgi:hypothetical protein
MSIGEEKTAENGPYLLLVAVRLVVLLSGLPMPLVAVLATYNWLSKRNGKGSGNCCNC